MDVVIDGVRYTPDSRIGVGITTHNRLAAFAKTLAEMRKHLPPGAKLGVVDDASKEPVAEADYRFEENAGIAPAKNKCSELVDGCEHIFLFDDDCYPEAPGWEEPYINSPEPHLAYHYLVSEGRSRGVVARYSGDDKHEAYAQSQGCMMYVHHSVLDAV